MNMFKSKYVQVMLLLIGLSNAFLEIGLKITNEQFLWAFSRNKFTSEFVGKDGNARPLGSIYTYWFAHSYYTQMENNEFGLRYFTRINQNPEYTLVKDLLSKEPLKTNSADLNLIGVCKIDSILDIKFETVKLNKADNSYDAFFLINCDPVDKQEDTGIVIQEDIEEKKDQENPKVEAKKSATGLSNLEVTLPQTDAPVESIAYEEIVVPEKEPKTGGDPNSLPPLLI